MASTQNFSFLLHLPQFASLISIKFFRPLVELTFLIHGSDLSFDKLPKEYSCFVHKILTMIYKLLKGNIMIFLYSFFLFFALNRFILRCFRYTLIHFSKTFSISKIISSLYLASISVAFYRKQIF